MSGCFVSKTSIDKSAYLRLAAQPPFGVQGTVGPGTPTHLIRELPRIVAYCPLAYDGL